METNKATPEFMARTPKEITAAFRAKGVPVSEWARAHGFNTSLVYRILSGSQKCSRGQSHEIAVRLGLKQGELGTLADLERELGSRRRQKIAPQITTDQEGQK